MEDGINLIIPVTRAALKTIEHPFKEPIFVRSGFKIATGRAVDTNFVGRENALAEGIFTNFPDVKGQQDMTAILVKNLRESWQRTGATLSLYSRPCPHDCQGPQCGTWLEGGRDFHTS